MPRGTVYQVAGRSYATQKELESEVKAALNSHPTDQQFYDGFLRTVVNELHPDVNAAGQQSSGYFIYLTYGEQKKRGMVTARRYRGGKLLMTWFEPLGGWRDVTVYPWRKSDSKSEVKAALREIIAPLLPTPRLFDRCGRVGCEAKGLELEYNHVDPTFDDIAEGCMATISAQELQSRFGYNKFAPGAASMADFIPRDHPAVKHLIKLHRDNTWEWLCKWHHRGVRPGGAES